MGEKIKKSLEQAKEYFYSLRLVEAYNIFRRYFDRLPFQPDPEHAEYIGMFARILAELGKEYDLNFYLGELERLYNRLKSPPIAYQLAVVYAYLSQPRLENSKRLLEEIIKDPTAKPYHAKAKMMLADYYDRVANDVATCRSLIDSIKDIQDYKLMSLVRLWDAKILIEENKFAEADQVLRDVLKENTPDSNWYAFYSAKVLVALLYIRQSRMEDARAVVEEARKLFEGKHFKSVEIQLAALENQLESHNQRPVITLEKSNGAGVLKYEKKIISLKGKTPSDKLLLLFAKRGFVDKAFIVKSLYSRQYDSVRDDKLIYYHIYSLRKRLRDFGVPGDAISSENNGYRFLPEVQTIEEEL